MCCNCTLVNGPRLRSALGILVCVFRADVSTPHHHCCLCQATQFVCREQRTQSHQMYTISSIPQRGGRELASA